MNITSEPLSPSSLNPTELGLYVFHPRQYSNIFHTLEGESTLLRVALHPEDYPAVASFPSFHCVDSQHHLHGSFAGVSVVLVGIPPTVHARLFSSQTSSSDHRPKQRDSVYKRQTMSSLPCADAFLGRCWDGTLFRRTFGRRHAESGGVQTSPFQSSDEEGGREANEARHGHLVADDQRLDHSRLVHRKAENDAGEEAYDIALSRVRVYCSYT